MPRQGDLSGLIIKNESEVIIMNFGQAIEALKEGKKVARAGWNGKGMFIFLFSESSFCTCCYDGSRDFHIDQDEINPIGHIGFEEKDVFYPIGDFILLKTAGNKCIPWVTSQEDVLAEDWVVAE